MRDPLSSLPEPITKGESLEGGFGIEPPSIEDSDAIVANLLAKQLSVLRAILKSNEEMARRLSYLEEYVAGIRVPSWLRKP